MTPSVVTNCSRTSACDQQEEGALFGVFLRENVVLVVENVEGLREFESKTREDRRLLRRDGEFHSRVERACQQYDIPEVVTRWRSEKGRDIERAALQPLYILGILRADVGI